MSPFPYTGESKGPQSQEVWQDSVCVSWFIFHVLVSRKYRNHFLLNLFFFFFLSITLLLVIFVSVHNRGLVAPHFYLFFIIQGSNVQHYNSTSVYAAK